MGLRYRLFGISLLACLLLGAGRFSTTTSARYWIDPLFLLALVLLLVCFLGILKTHIVKDLDHTIERDAQRQRDKDARDRDASDGNA